jgi:hypothetical protein
MSVARRLAAALAVVGVGVLAYAVPASATASATGGGWQHHAVCTGNQRMTDLKEHGDTGAGMPWQGDRGSQGAGDTWHQAADASNVHRRQAAGNPGPRADDDDAQPRPDAGGTQPQPGAGKGRLTTRERPPCRATMPKRVMLPCVATAPQPAPADRSAGKPVRPCRATPKPVPPCKATPKPVPPTSGSHRKLVQSPCKPTGSKPAPPAGESPRKPSTPAGKSPRTPSTPTPSPTGLGAAVLPTTPTPPVLAETGSSGTLPMIGLGGLLLVCGIGLSLGTLRRRRVD